MIWLKPTVISKSICGLEKKTTSHGLYLSTRKEGVQYQVTNCLTITDRCNCDSLLTFPRMVKITSINSTKPDTIALNRWPNTNQWCGSLQPKSNSFWLILPSFFINDYSIGKQFAKNHIIDPSQVTLWKLKKAYVGAVHIIIRISQAGFWPFYPMHINVV